MDHITIRAIHTSAVGADAASDNRESLHAQDQRPTTQKFRYYSASPDQMSIYCTKEEWAMIVARRPLMDFEEDIDLVTSDTKCSWGYVSMKF